MRTIKFRAWDKENQLWRGGQELDKYERLAILSSPQFIIQQFTGLLDKNGKEIYEGDILQFNMPLAPKPQVREIIYSDKHTAFVVKGGDYMPPTDWVIQVIGNIYENPELINK